MSIDIRVEFENNPAGIYYAGQLVRGKVYLTVRKQKKVRGVHVRIRGKAHCYWTHQDTPKSGTSFYNGNERFLDEKIYLIGGPNDTVHLTPGTEAYDFQCNLPNQLPTTVEGKKGYIRYMALVTVDIPMAIDKGFDQHFTVIRPLNLNASPELRQKATSTKRETDCCDWLCCCCCCCCRLISSPIKVAAEIPVSGYTPGQTINLDLRVSHKGRAKEHKFDVKLVKRIDYYANSSGIDFGNAHNEDIQYLAEKEVSISDNEVVRVNLQVPPVPPTDVTSSEVVKVKYYLSISTSSLFLSLFNGTSDYEIPITIGTYPIQDANAPILSEKPSLYAPLPGSADTANLLTFEDAMDMEDAGCDNYKPKYPVFKHATSYSREN